jgi:hypothetical protein
VINFDRLDAAAIGALSDVELEIARLRMLHQSDERYELVLCHLVIRGLPVIVRVCHEGAEAGGLRADQRDAAVEDASVRLLLRANRLEQLPPVGAIAAQIAADCLSAQSRKRFAPSRLTAERPKLRAIEGLAPSRALRNDWRIP